MSEQRISLWIILCGQQGDVLEFDTMQWDDAVPLWGWIMCIELEHVSVHGSQ